MSMRSATMVAGVVLSISCGGHSPAASPAPAASSVPAESAASGTADWFTDRAKDSGLDFTHFNGMSGELYMPEILGPGVALFDCDNDGDLDVYVVQGQMLGRGKTVRDASFPPSPSTPLTDRLYRNDLRINEDGTRTLHFTDVTATSGIVSHGYGMGVASADFDNDGRADLYLTKFAAPNQLFHNSGGCTFTDVSKQSATDVSGWSVSAAFVDIDRDGWLDLYVGSYLRYRVDSNTRCSSPSGAPDYCTPRSYQALPGRLYRNRGNGTFEDITSRSHLGSEFGPGLGVVTADFDGDGWMDLYVANDGKENQLWLNQRDGTFRNVALLAGVALPIDGKAEGSMGVDAADIDDDGDEDLVMTELTGEGANLYVNDGSANFVDRSASSGLGPGTLQYTGFGVGWVDVDNDGRLDVLAVNGTVQMIEALRLARDPFPLHQRKLLFLNGGQLRFDPVGARFGAVFALSDVGRGLAFGDIDNDGDTDVLVGNNNGPLRLLINNRGNRNHWIGLRLVERRSGRDALGARVEILRKDGSRMWRRAHTDGSYASAGDPRILAGLGNSAEPSTVRVHWLDGLIEEWQNVGADRYTLLREGSGR